MSNFAPRGSNFAPWGVPDGLPEPSGTSWAPGRPEEGALGGKGGVGKLHGGLLGPSLGPLGVSWARFGSICPPPGGARGAVPEGIFEGFFGTSRLRGKNCAFFEYLKVFRPYFYPIFCPLLPSLLRGRRHRAFAKILKKHWFLWVASHMCLFLAAPEAIKFQRARVANND